jgi:hypothetical protein
VSGEPQAARLHRRPCAQRGLTKIHSKQNVTISWAWRGWISQHVTNEITDIWRAVLAILMSAETATIIQTVAAIIQASAAVVFFFSVRRDVRARRLERERQLRLTEQERRDRFVGALRQLWVQSCVATFSVAMTDEELSGFYSQRQIDFFNQQLEARGETWRYPFKRVE